MPRRSCTNAASGVIRNPPARARPAPRDERVVRCLSAAPRRSARRSSRDAVPLETRQPLVGITEERGRCPGKDSGGGWSRVWSAPGPSLCLPAARRSLAQKVQVATMQAVEVRRRRRAADFMLGRTRRPLASASRIATLPRWAARRSQMLFAPLAGMGFRFSDPGRTLSANVGKGASGRPMAASAPRPAPGAGPPSRERSIPLPQPSRARPIQPATDRTRRPRENRARDVWSRPVTAWSSRSARRSRRPRPRGSSRGVGVASPQRPDAVRAVPRRRCPRRHQLLRGLARTRT